MDQQIVALIAGHKWFALAAILIGLFVRLLKSDAAFFPTLPESWKKWKPAIAIGLGIAVGVLNALATGTPIVSATDRIKLTKRTAGGTEGHPRISAITAATSFVITSSSGTDTSTFEWEF